MSWRSGRDQPPSHRSHFPGQASGRHAPRLRRTGRLDHLRHWARTPSPVISSSSGIAAGDRLKILYWDRDGLAIWAKRLERGVFRFPEPKDDRIEVTPAEMAAILEGIDLKLARRQRRFVLPALTPS